MNVMILNLVNFEEANTTCIINYIISLSRLLLMKQTRSAFCNDRWNKYFCYNFQYFFIQSKQSSHKDSISNSHVFIELRLFDQVRHKKHIIAVKPNPSLLLGSLAPDSEAGLGILRQFKSTAEQNLFYVERLNFLQV